MPLRWLLEGCGAQRGKREGPQQQIESVSPTELCSCPFLVGARGGQVKALSPLPSQLGGNFKESDMEFSEARIHYDRRGYAIYTVWDMQGRLFQYATRDEANAAFPGAFDDHPDNDKEAA